MKRASILALLVFLAGCSDSALLSVSDARASAERNREKQVVVVGYYFQSAHGDFISPVPTGITDDSIALAIRSHDAGSQLSYTSLKTGERYAKQQVRIRGALKRGAFPVGPGAADDYVFLVVEAVETG